MNPLNLAVLVAMLGSLGWYYKDFVITKLGPLRNLLPSFQKEEPSGNQDFNLMVELWNLRSRFVKAGRVEDARRLTELIVSITCESDPTHDHTNS